MVGVGWGVRICTAICLLRLVYGSDSFIMSNKLHSAQHVMIS